MINVDFFGLELEALFLNLVYFHGEDFRVNRSLVKHCLTKLKKNGSRWLSFSTYYYFFYLFCYHAMYWRWRTDETNCHPTFLPNYAVQNTFLKGNLCLYLSSNGFHISILISTCNSQGWGRDGTISYPHLHPAVHFRLHQNFRCTRFVPLLIEISRSLFYSHTF